MKHVYALNRLNQSIKLGIFITVLGLLGLFFVFPFFYMGWPKAPAAIANAEKGIVLDIHKQALYGYRKGKLKFRYKIETGKLHHETPTGRFRVARKDANYHSHEYNAPMPFALFFVPERGIAMHTNPWVLPHWVFERIFRTGRHIGSHGCVRLGMIDSARLFHWTPVDTPVVVVDRLVPH